MPDAETYQTEVWTFGGITSGVKFARVAVWYDAERKRLAYKVRRGDSGHVVGGNYNVQVRRDGGSVIRDGGDPLYRGRHHDIDWVRQLEAEAYAADQQAARARLERRDARVGELDKLIAPVAAAAGHMTYAQREAFLARITRAIYRAERPIGAKK